MTSPCSWWCADVKLDLILQKGQPTENPRVLHTFHRNHGKTPSASAGGWAHRKAPTEPRMALGKRRDRVPSPLGTHSSAGERRLGRVTAATKTKRPRREGRTRSAQADAEPRPRGGRPAPQGRRARREERRPSRRAAPLRRGPGPCPRRRARPGRSAAGTQMREQGGLGRAAAGRRRGRAARGSLAGATREEPGLEARGPPRCPPGAGSCLPPLGSRVSPAPLPPRPFPGGHLSDVSDSQSPLSYLSNSQWALRLMVRTRAKTRKGRARGATDCSEKEGGGAVGSLALRRAAQPGSPRAASPDCAGGARAPLHLRRPRGAVPGRVSPPDWLLRSASCLAARRRCQKLGVQCYRLCSARTGSYRYLSPS